MLDAKGPPPEADADRIDGFGRMHLLEVQARMIVILLPELIGISRPTLNISRKPLKSLPKSFSDVGGHRLPQPAWCGRP